MFENVLLWALGAAGLATCLLGGVFLSFSDFIMRSFNRANPAAGVEAMQVLNREIYRSVFMVLFIGMAVCSIALGVWVMVRPPQAGGLLIVVGCIAYVAGVFIVTALGNVPKNNRLAGHPDASAEALAYWPAYYRGWMFWNHVRTAFCLVSALCFMAAVVQLAAGRSL